MNDRARPHPLLFLQFAVVVVWILALNIARIESAPIGSTLFLIVSLLSMAVGLTSACTGLLALYRRHMSFTMLQYFALAATRYFKGRRAARDLENGYVRPAILKFSGMLELITGVGLAVLGLAFAAVSIFASAAQ